MPISTISTGGIADSINIDNGTLVVDGVNNRVGIGTSSPATALTIASEGKLRLYRADNARYGDIYNDNSFLNIETSNDPIKLAGQTYIRFDTDGSETMRISGGNLLVGTTDGLIYNHSGSGAVDGVVLGTSGVIQATAASGEVLFLNRLVSDGTIVDFRKDGTTVGSIGAKSGDIYIGTGDTGVRFNDGDNAVYAANTTTGGASDGNISLGVSAARFKDLYLSGGVYLGGTGSANYLDDYEEGTWTPQDGGGTDLSSVSHASYTKVGRLVTLLFDFTYNTYVGSLPYRVGGLPFTAFSTGYAAGTVAYNDTGAVRGLLVAHGTTAFDFTDMQTSFPTASTKRFIGSVTYFTA